MASWAGFFGAARVLGIIRAPQAGAWSSRHLQPDETEDKTPTPPMWTYHSTLGFLVSVFPAPNGKPMAFPLYALRQAGWLVSDVGMRLLPRADALRAFNPADVEGAVKEMHQRAKGMRQLRTA